MPLEPRSFLKRVPSVLLHLAMKKAQRAFTSNLYVIIDST